MCFNQTFLVCYFNFSGMFKLHNLTFQYTRVCFNLSVMFCVRVYVCVCSAKMLVRGEPNVSYICSRYYRAPELIFGATDYTCDIGMVDHAIVSSCYARADIPPCMHMLIFCHACTC